MFSRDIILLYTVYYIPPLHVVCGYVWEYIAFTTFPPGFYISCNERRTHVHWYILWYPNTCKTYTVSNVCFSHSLVLSFFFFNKKGHTIKMKILNFLEWYHGCCKVCMMVLQLFWKEREREIIQSENWNELVNRVRICILRFLRITSK